MIWSEILVEFCSVLGTGDLSMLDLTSAFTSVDAAKELDAANEFYAANEFDAENELEAKESFYFISAFKVFVKELNN